MWENYFDLGKSVHEIVQCLMKEDKRENLAPTGGANAPKGDSGQIVGIPGNKDTIMMPKAAFPGQDDSSAQPLGTADNPVNLSDAPTYTSTQGTRPRSAGIEDKAKILGHFSDTLDEMAQCIETWRMGTSWHYGR